MTPRRPWWRRSFSLTSITVKAGADVYFSNGGTIDHTMTSDDGTSFDTGSVTAGQTKESPPPRRPASTASTARSTRAR